MRGRGECRGEDGEEGGETLINFSSNLAESESPGERVSDAGADRSMFRLFSCPRHFDLHEECFRNL
jgi:hypothetical protein